MICNKCGKNNPAGAEKCSFCKEPMPSTANCGGFSDILTYTAPVAPDTAPPLQPAPAPVRQVIEPQVDEPWYASILSKKNIISLAAILLCIITLAVVIAVSCSSPDSDEKDENFGLVGTSENDDDDDDDTLGEFLKDVESISTSNENFPEYKFDEDQTEVSLELKDEDGESIDIVLVRVDADKNLILSGPTKVSKEMFDSGFSILFKAEEDDFPLKIYYNGEAEPFKLNEKHEWVPDEEKGEGKEGGNSSSEEMKIPDFVKKPVESPAEKQEVQVILKPEDLSFPEDAKTATLVIKGGNNKNIANSRIFVVGFDGKDAKPVSGTYSKEEFDNIKMIVVNVLANSELINGSVKEAKFTKVS